MSKKLGALPDRILHEMISVEFIKGSLPEHVGPASLDLCVSEEMYRVNGMFQPKMGEPIRALIKRLDVRPHQEGVPFEREVVYLVRLKESLKLLHGVYGYCNPKSSTGRHDVHTRVLADGVPRYDAVTPAGFEGELWAVIIPHSYPVII
ncbi:MAG: 2'-deoxycytidine 5'-triphosphate deaminase, partial [Minisyncoccia bacterium]